MTAWSCLHGHVVACATPDDEVDLLGFLQTEPAQTGVPAADTVDVHNANGRACVFFLTHSFASDQAAIPCPPFQRRTAVPHATYGTGQDFAWLGCRPGRCRPGR